MKDWKSHLRNARVLIVGCGATGASMARFAVQAGAAVRVVDSRAVPPMAEMLQRELPHVEVRVGTLDASALQDMDHMVVSPGVDLAEPLIAAARRAGFEIIGDIEWFARMAEAPVVAVTGSNGKSTVTAWVGQILSRAGLNTAVGGNFGTPALALLAQQPDVYVLELSSFQLELTQYLPCQAATVLNISADHMDRHGSVARYAAIKARIFKAAQTALLNADDGWSSDMDTGAASVLHFGVSPSSGYRLTVHSGNQYLMHDDKPLMAVSELGVPGRHNALNALAVWALTATMGVDDRTIRSGLMSFTGLPHRCQLVAEVEDVQWINDSKGTNPGAQVASLMGLERPVVLLAGGQAKGADFSELGEVAGHKIRLVLAYGQDAARFVSALGERARVEQVAGMADAIRRAAEVARPGDAVLLSPGCASFDEFESYRARGEAFVAAVREMAA